MRISDGSSDVCSSDLLSKNRVSVGEFANGLHPAIDERLVLVGAISGQVACVEPCLMHALGAEMMLGREPRRIVEAADRQIHIPAMLTTPLIYVADAGTGHVSIGGSVNLIAALITLTTEGLRALIQFYTREAGVRTLEREIAKLARKALRKILEGKAESVTITPDNLGEFAGVRKYRYGLSEEENQIGAVTGLAWTEVGGELLTIESVTVPGKGQAKTTGKLGDVMKESVEAAFSFIKARSPSYGIKPSLFNRKDVHIHLPEGAVPKDGPSAGIGIVTSIVSKIGRAHV